MDEKVFPNESPLMLRLRIREVQMSAATRRLGAEERRFVRTLRSEALGRRSSSLADIAAKLMIMFSDETTDAEKAAPGGEPDRQPLFPAELELDDLNLLFRKMVLSDAALADATDMMDALKSIVTMDGRGNMRVLVERLQKIWMIHDDDPEQIRPASTGRPSPAG